MRVGGWNPLETSESRFKRPVQVAQTSSPLLGILLSLRLAYLGVRPSPRPNRGYPVLHCRDTTYLDPCYTPVVSVFLVALFTC